MTDTPTPLPPQTGYRAALYRHYATLTGRTSASTRSREKREFAAYSHYLRGWLPRDKGSAILDAGCGSGRFLAFLQRQGYSNAQGLDISPEQVELARNRGLDVAHGDILTCLSDNPRRFDTIAAMDLAEHLTKDELLRFLDLARNALRPGGRLIIQTPNPESPFFGAVRYADLTHETSLGPGMLGNILRQAGFTDFRLRETGPIPRGYSLKSSARWLLWQIVRTAIRLCHRIETGAPGAGPCTRVYLARASRRDEASPRLAPTE